MRVYVISAVDMPHGGTIKEVQTILHAFEEISFVSASYLIAMPSSVKKIEEIITVTPKIRWVRKRKRET